MPALDSEETAARIAQARAVLGSGTPTDYLLAPVPHAALLDQAAPQLAALLRSSAIEITAQRYEARDAAAREAQAAFRTLSSRARAAVFLTGIAAALVLVAGGLWGALGTGPGKVLMVMASIVAVTAGALASLWIRRIRDGRLLEEWMTRRAEAETERLKYFELVTRPQGGLDPLLQLEYFRRYQLDVQRAYYGVRGAQHRTEADRALSRSSAGMAFGGVASGVAGILGAAFSAPAWAALAGLGLIGQAYASAVENGEATAQDRRNAERYGRTRHALEELYALIDAVRAATAAGESEALPAYVASVHEQLSVEHRQWLEEISAGSQAVARLESLLQEYRAKSGSGS